MFVPSRDGQSSARKPEVGTVISDVAVGVESGVRVEVIVRVRVI